MAQYLTLTATFVVFTLAGCSADSDAIVHDLNTPEGAILSLEDAYRAKDRDAAIRCRDFTVEATLMLKKNDNDLSGDADILSKAAEVLELGFRGEMTQSGFPDFQGIVSTFSNKKPYLGHDDIVEITEHCRQ